MEANNNAIIKEEKRMSWAGVFAATLLMSAPVRIDFEELLNLHHRQESVEIRGFAYQASDGSWILSPDPQLKSCCIGSKAKAKQQILLSGDFSTPPKARALVVEGTLQIDPTREIGYYSLHNARIIANEGAFPWRTSGLFIGLCAIVGICAFFFKKQHKP